MKWKINIQPKEKKKKKTKSKIKFDNQEMFYSTSILLLHADSSKREQIKPSIPTYTHQARCESVQNKQEWVSQKAEDDINSACFGTTVCTKSTKSMHQVHLDSDIGDKKVHVVHSVIIKGKPPPVYCTVMTAQISIYQTCNIFFLPLSFIKMNWNRLKPTNWQIMLMNSMNVMKTFNSVWKPSFTDKKKKIQIRCVSRYINLFCIIVVLLTHFNIMSSQHADRELWEK